MAGKPKRRAMVAELERRAAAEHEGDVLAYATEWVSDGRSFAKLARDLEKSLAFSVSRSFLSTYINTLRPDAPTEIAKARAEGAHAILEQAQIRSENVEANRDDIARVKLQNDLDLWLAERWNRADLGQAKGAQVHISIGALHLDALQAPAVVPIAIANAIAEEAEILSIEESTT